jgi:hypothetical protein
MKNTKIIAFLAAGSLLLGAPGCKRAVDGLNDDPNNFSDAPAELMITQAQLANTLVQEGELARLAGIMSGHFRGADRQYVSFDQYTIVTGDFDNIWETLYAEGVKQVRIIKGKAASTGNTDLEAVAMILEANFLGTAAALWGDVPNSQATNLNFPKPAFDGQVSVYDYVIGLLDSAIAKNPSPGAFSVTYVSNNFSWVEVAYTLKARYLLHKKDYAGALAAANMGISAPDADWEALHSEAGEFQDGKFNLYYSFLDWNRAGYMTADGSYILEIMTDTASATFRGNAKTNDSARAAFYFLEGGYTAVDPNWSDGVFSYEASFDLASYAETQFIIAECEYRTSGTEANMLTALNNVRAVLDADFGGYDAYALTDFDPAGIADAGKGSQRENLFYGIMNEKFTTLYGQIENFNDMRRTDNVLDIPLNVAGNNNGKGFVQRFLVPQSEVNTNRANVPASGLDLYAKTAVNQ